MWYNQQRSCEDRQTDNGWPYLSDQSEHNAQFLIDVGFNTGFNLKDKVTLKFSIVISLMLIVAFDAEFHMEHQTVLQLHAAQQSSIIMNLPNAFKQVDLLYP